MHGSPRNRQDPHDQNFPQALPFLLNLLDGQGRYYGHSLFYYAEWASNAFIPPNHLVWNYNDRTPNKT